MVVSVDMSKPCLKVSVSDSDSSSADESGESENEVESGESENEAMSGESENEAKSGESENEAKSGESENEAMSGESENEAKSGESENEAKSGESENEANSSESENEVEMSTDDAEADSDSAASTNANESDSELLMKNEGWADSVTKILGSSKPKNKKTLVLSRAKKYKEVVKKETEEKPSFEVIGDIKEEKIGVKEELTSTEPPVKKKKHEKASIRVKPNILEKDREKLLAKIATKGVVQLFNAVRNQQKTLEKEIDRTDITESKKEKILRKFDKRTFLDTLMGPTKSVVVDEVKTLKNEVKHENKPQWSALRDDFMMGAKMKDWDKESVDE